MNARVPAALRYSLAHMWARLESDGNVTIGITDHAQHQLGDLQYVGLPRIGSMLLRDASLGEIESTKTVSDLYAPCSGAVVAVNDAVVDDPTAINRDPYGAGWIASVAPSDRAELDELLAAPAYAEHVAGDAH